MKADCIASGATGNIVDTRVFNSQREELGPDCGAQVDPGLGALRCHDEPDPSRDVVTDFEAARTDARADRRNRRQRIQPFDTRAHNPQNDATPSRMNRCDVAAHLVGDENRHAIGDSHSHCDAEGCRAICSTAHRSCPADDRVGFFTAFGRVDCAGAMQLPNLCDVRRTEGTQQLSLRRVARRKSMEEARPL
jgi:hypothetical protein